MCTFCYYKDEPEKALEQERSMVERLEKDIVEHLGEGAWEEALEMVDKNVKNIGIEMTSENLYMAYIGMRDAANYLNESCLEKNNPICDDDAAFVAKKAGLFLARSYQLKEEGK